MFRKKKNNKKFNNDTIFTFDPVIGTSATDYLYTSEFDKFLGGFRKFCSTVLKNIHADEHNKSYMNKMIETNIEQMRSSLDLQKANHDFSAYVICSQIEGYEVLLQAQEAAINSIRNNVAHELEEISAIIDRAEARHSDTEVNE